MRLSSVLKVVERFQRVLGGLHVVPPDLSRSLQQHDDIVLPHVFKMSARFRADLVSFVSCQPRGERDRCCNRLPSPSKIQRA